ncbi:F-box domain protein [Trichostrongylus colubriformis]|uniref:F-box domain protein n=1 Tax=Trichostrongylus colubriformis TaxID=6319 RepID=A0AAN8IDU0_TRICO
MGPRHDESSLLKDPSWCFPKTADRNLADLAFVNEKKVKWTLKRGKDQKFYLHLKDIEHADIPQGDSLLSFLSPKSNRCPSTAFHFFELPSELQLQILRELPSRDINSCRLTCKWMNRFIVGNWIRLRSREIGCVDFIPECREVWGLYYDYSKELTSFQHSVISRLVIQYGIISSSLMQSLTKTLSDLRICVKTLIIHNCRCDCTVLELINFIKCTYVEVLAIDVFDMREFGQSLAKHEVVRNMNCSLVYVNGDDVISGVVVNSFYQGSVDLNGFSRLLTDWGHGCVEIIHFHMNIDDDGAAYVPAICQDSAHFRYLRGSLYGCVLKNCDNQELYVETKDGRLMLTPGSLSENS